jgi:YidC/Oxa1 family membrane protein insertase
MRILVPLIAIVIGVVFALAVARNGADAPPIPEDDPAGQTESVEAVASGESEEASEADTAAAPDTEPPASANDEAEPSTADTSPGTKPGTTSGGETSALTGLRAVPATSAEARAVGSDTAGDPYQIRVAFTKFGAGVRRITLADYAQFVDDPPEGQKKPPYRLVDVEHGIAEGTAPAFYPFAARSITLNGQTVSLFNVAWTPGELKSSDAGESVTYRLLIVDGDDRPVAEIVRTWSVAPGSYELELDQRILNRTDAPLDVTFSQFGQGDVLTDLGAYLGDRRMFITGHFRDETPPKTLIHVDNSFITRSELLKKERVLWPNEDLPADKNPRLAWLASENRYFALITHAPIPADAEVTADVPELDAVFPDISYQVRDQTVDAAYADTKRVAVLLGSGAVTVAPGEAKALDVVVFAGPRKDDILETPPYSLMHFDKLIRYELGCTWCTFQWLAKGLLGYLEALHWLVRDWGVAIIILVLTVRLLLHPITKRAQTNMLKMSKQMQSVQPEMAKLKEKFKDDPASLNRETMKLYREKGINPANMLGCLPMLLQTPIWIALYAMLYYAIELRHEPAFYGFFQTISGGQWHFLEDLSVSDNFLRFIPPDQPAWKLTWLPFIEPEFRSLNILPLLMAFVFFFQMKLTTPPPQNDQQRQQQMIMKFMPFMFPIFLYSAPSGLTLYICASTAAGIVDSWIVRKHVREQEEAGTLFDKKPIKPGGFRDRLSKRVEMAQKLAAERQSEMQKQKRGGSGASKNFKKRK